MIAAKMIANTPRPKKINPSDKFANPNIPNTPLPVYDCIFKPKRPAINPTIPEAIHRPTKGLNFGKLIAYNAGSVIPNIPVIGNVAKDENLNARSFAIKAHPKTAPACANADICTQT